MPFGGFIKRFKDRLYREVKQQVLNEVKREFPDPKSYLHDYEATDATTGRSLHVSYRQLELLYKKESWVRAAVGVIERTTTAKGFKLVPIAGADLGKVDQERLGKLIALFEEPNAEDTFTDIASEIVIDLHTYGDAYIEVVTGKDGLPSALYNVYCPSLRVLVDEHGVVQGYIQIQDGWGSQNSVTFNDDQIEHFRLHNPGNEVYGLSPLESLAMPIEIDLYAQAYNRDFFKNDATPRLHVDMGNCTIDQLKRNREYWRSTFRGTGNPHKTIITEGGATCKPIGTPPKDMEFLNQRKFSRDEILSVYGVPPSKVGIMDSANRSNSDAQDKTFKEDKIMPLQRYLADKINRQIVSKFDVPYKFEFVELDIEDAKSQAEIDEIHLQQGVVTINEIRRKRGLKDVSWGDAPLIRENVAPLTTEEEAPKPDTEE